MSRKRKYQDIQPAYKHCLEYTITQIAKTHVASVATPIALPVFGDKRIKVVQCCIVDMQLGSDASHHILFGIVETVYAAELHETQDHQRLLLRRNLAMQPHADIIHDRVNVQVLAHGVELRQVVKHLEPHTRISDTKMPV